LGERERKVGEVDERGGSPGGDIWGRPGEVPWEQVVVEAGSPREADQTLREKSEKGAKGEKIMQNEPIFGSYDDEKGAESVTKWSPGEQVICGAENGI